MAHPATQYPRIDTLIGFVPPEPMAGADSLTYLERYNLDTVSTLCKTQPTHRNFRDVNDWKSASASVVRTFPRRLLGSKGIGRYGNDYLVGVSHAIISYTAAGAECPTK